MFRLIGYLGGIILFLVLGVVKVNGYVYFLICAILNISTIFFIIIFRALAQYLNGFWKIWCKRLQKWISGALMCLGKYTQMPEYEVVLIKGENGQKTVATEKRNRTNFLWGLVELVVCIGFTGVAPVILLFVFFIYGESIYYECQFKKNQRQFDIKKEEIVARQSSRMSLGMSQLEQGHQNRKSSSSTLRSVSLVYPLMEPAIVPKSSQSTFEMNKSQQNPYTLRYRLSPTTELKTAQTYQKLKNIQNTPPQKLTIDVQEINRIHDSPREEDMAGSLPRYRGVDDLQRKDTYGMKQEIQNDQL